MKSYFNRSLSLIFSPTGKSISQILSANFISAAAGFLTSVVILRNLPDDEISILYPLVGMMLICAQFGDLGISQSFIKLASSYFKNDKLKALRYFNITLKAKLALAIIIFVIGVSLSSHISLWLLNSTKYSTFVAITFFATIFQILSSFYSSTLQIEGKFKTLTAIRSIPPLLKLGLIYSLLSIESLNLETTIYAFFLVPVIATALGLFASTKETYTTPSSKSDFLEIFKYSKWILVATLCSTAIGQVDILMIKKMSSVDQVSILVGGQRLASVLPLITTAFVTILLPKVSSMNGKQELNYFFRKSLTLLPIIALILIVLYFVSSPLISMILGERYLQAIPIFQLYIIGFAISIYITPLSLILYKLNKEYIFAFLAATQLIVNIIGNYLLIPHYSAAGAAGVSAAIKLIGLLVTLAVLYRNGIIFYHKKS